MSRYAHVRSLDHAERLLRQQADKVRQMAIDNEVSVEFAASLRGKAAAYHEAAQLVSVLRRKWETGDLEEARKVVEATMRELQPKIHIGASR